MRTDDQEAMAKARGRRLKAAREHLRLKTAKAAAAHLRVNYTTYSQHERGERDLTRDVALDYADQLGVPEEWLLSGKNPPAWAEGDLEMGRDEPNTAPANQLRAWREHAKLSVADLADMVRATTEMIEAWEAGTADLSDRWLRRLAERLNTTPGSILDMDPEAAPPGLLTLWRETMDRQHEVGGLVRALKKAG